MSPKVMINQFTSTLWSSWLWVFILFLQRQTLYRQWFFINQSIVQYATCKASTFICYQTLWALSQYLLSCQMRLIS